MRNIVYQHNADYIVYHTCPYRLISSQCPLRRDLRKKLHHLGWYSWGRGGAYSGRDRGAVRLLYGLKGTLGYHTTTSYHTLDCLRGFLGKTPHVTTCIACAELVSNTSHHILHCFPGTLRRQPTDHTTPERTRAQGTVSEAAIGHLSCRNRHACSGSTRRNRRCT